MAQFDFNMPDEAFDPNLGDHGLVDTVDFKRLKDRTTFLRKILLVLIKINGFDNAC